MVRRMVAALIAVGTGKIDEDAVARALLERGPAFRGAAAPARGLCLRRVALGRRQRTNDEDEGDIGNEGRDE
jgi:tRNA U38,U39,U40 pseudouridine synthase TruA